MSTPKKGLGRGLSALIPDAEMEFLSQIARGDESLQALPVARKPREFPPAGSGRAKKLSRNTNPSSGKKAGQPDQMKKPVVTATASSGQAGTDILRQQTAPDISVPSKQGEVGTISQSVAWIRPQEIEANPFQPRRIFSESEMADLVSSIREHGILQPILAREIPPLKRDGSAIRYQLVAGERRWRASQKAGLETIPAIIRPVDDQQALELALIENVQRHDISPLDTALAYKRLSQEFKLSQEAIAQRVGKSRPAVTNAIRLLELPDEVKQAMDEQLLSEGHGRAILLAEGDGARRAVFRRILRDKLSVRETEEIARATQPEGTEGNSKKGQADKEKASQDESIAHLQQVAQKLLGRRINIRTRRKGGFLVIPFVNSEDLGNLISQIGENSIE